MSGRSGSSSGNGTDNGLAPNGDGTDAADAGTDAADPTPGALVPAGDPATGADTLPGPGRPPGAAIFSLDNRAAPALYLIGWVATVLGLAVLAALVLSGPGGTGALALALVSTGLLAIGLVAAAGAQGIQRRARGDAYTGPSPFLVFVAALPIVLPIAIIALRLAEGAGVDPAGPLGSVIGQAVLVLGLIALVRLLVIGAGALTWSDMAIRWPGVVRAVNHLVWGALFAVPVILATGLLAGVLVNLLGTTPDSPLPTAKDSAGIALNFLAAVVIAPIGEEIFFRGFSLTAWERAVGWRGALIRSSLFFAFVHVLTVGGVTFSDAAARAFIGFAVRIPVAFALGWVFIQRRSIFAPIGLHAAFNGLLLLIATAAP